VQFGGGMRHHPEGTDVVPFEAHVNQN
jgi:hypothetical protein